MLKPFEWESLEELLQEIGSGERISLAKLAVTHLERTSRPLRIAVDISIWLFRVQAGRGGTNPEVRTLFFRLLKLLALPIHPVFVFDGAHKPPFKRGKATGQGGNAGASTLSLRLSKRLIDLFSFPRHTAPGEAEAECAQLQVAGVVDAVMSDDVDTLMFGSRTTIMNFSRENSSGTDAASHVNLYQADDGPGINVSLKRAEMILFAMLSGGDYLPSGVPKCGRKTAAEITRAGFGSDLLEAIKGKDNAKLIEWRKRLQRELNDNESGFFQRRHRALIVPETFPDRTILSYYLNPVVSTPEEIERLRRNLTWDKDIDVVELQRFVDNTLGWGSTPGLKRFIKVFSGPFLSYRLRLKIPYPRQETSLTVSSEAQPMQKVYRERAIFANDGIPELQFEFIPAQVTGIEPNDEPSDSLALPSTDQELGDELDPEDEPPANNKRAPKEYDPHRPEKIWIFETVAEIGAPDAVAAWRLEQERKEAALNEAKAKKAERAAAKARKKNTLDPGMKQGDIYRYTNVVKPGIQRSERSERSSAHDGSLQPSSAAQTSPSPRSSKTSNTKVTKSTVHSPTKKKRTPGLLSSPKVDKSINPFSIARSQAESRSKKILRDTHRAILEQDIFTSIPESSQKDTEDDPFLRGSSPPPLPPNPNPSFAGPSDATAVGSTTDPITISSSPPRLSTILGNTTQPRSQITTPGQSSQNSPQTPPISSQLFSDEFPFPSSTNLLTPTPKPRSKPREMEPPTSPLHSRDRSQPIEADEDDIAHFYDDLTTDPFTSPLPTDIPTPKDPKFTSNIQQPTTIHEPTPSFSSPSKPPQKQSAYFVDSYNGYWTCGKEDKPADADSDTDTPNPDSSSQEGKGKGKTQRKKYGRVSILDLS
ncbi:hypothetical protein FQN54_001759 [Arachnomyces sp. PD_36]|nr:hypothetical protein FQN54_001759 [Arachnomyces sp. PD_36]